MRRKKPTATPPKVAGIVLRLEAAHGELVDASELAGAGGKEPALASLAENGRAPSGACTDAGIGVLGWCVAAFELREARVHGAAGFVRVISARRACPDAAEGVNVASAGKRRDAAAGELRRSAGAYAPWKNAGYCLSEY